MTTHLDRPAPAAAASPAADDGAGAGTFGLPTTTALVIGTGVFALYSPSPPWTSASPRVAASPAGRWGRRKIARIITQTLGSAADPAFAIPSTFIGYGRPDPEARRLAAERGWKVKADGENWRRVVGSLTPQRVVETRLNRRLLDAGVLIICAGGGGAPVVRNQDGHLEGAHAVVERDTTTNFIAGNYSAGFGAVPLEGEGRR